MSAVAPSNVMYNDSSGNPVLVAAATPLPVTAIGGGSFAAGNGSSGASTASWTPVAEAYSANDTISTAQEFADIGPSGGGEVMITSASLMVAHTAVISGETSYLLYLYNVTPPSALANNAAFDIPSGDRASFVARIDLGTPVDLGSTLLVQTDGINKQVTVPSGGSLFGYLVTVGAFTATAAARQVTLHTAAV